ncbi:MmgE/PrpD family protein [Amorphus sp. MBR-141]
MERTWLSGEVENWRDDIAEALAVYSVAGWRKGHVAHLEPARRLLLDTLAVGLGAYRHPAAAIARQFLSFYPSEGKGASIWGTRLRAAAPVAALVNGVPLRCYDYNDVLVGRLSPGHPSDMVAPLLALSETLHRSGRDVLDALAVGYQIAATLYEFVPSEDSGWDHANLSALGAVGALARLMRLSQKETAEAMGIVAIQHLQSNEIESSAPNLRGDLTMWKRFHGADIMRYALEACLLASKGAEGPVRPFRGDLGFLSIFKVTEDPGPHLARGLCPDTPPLAIGSANLKRWPVGSRAQSAIQAVLDARAQLPEGAEITEVNVRTEQGVYDHLVAIRDDPWNPKSREAADHSLPYVVGAAALDGRITVESFDLDRVLDPRRALFIAERVKIRVDPALGDSDASNLTEVELVTSTGVRFTGAARPAKGHHTRPFGASDLSEKLHESAGAILPAAQLDSLADTVAGLEHVADIGVLIALLAGDNSL